MHSPDEKKESLVDSHCHLDFPEFEKDLDSVISKALKVGVYRMLTICTKPINLEKVLTIVEKYPSVYFAAGSHPLHVQDPLLFSYEKLISISKHPKMLGIGETGLDYFYSVENAELQKENFKLHIKAARDTNLPLIVHSRSADEDMIKILSDEFSVGKFDCVLHCFSSGVELANLAIKLGFYISISGIATFPKSIELRGILSNVPLNRILIETDSPYLSPVPNRGKRNEPSFVADTSKYMATFFNLTDSEFRKTTTENFNRIFGEIKSSRI